MRAQVCMDAFDFIRGQRRGVDQHFADIAFGIRRRLCRREAPEGEIEITIERGKGADFQVRGRDIVDDD